MGWFGDKEKRKRTGAAHEDAPDAILPADHGWFVDGLDDNDLGAEATARRVQAVRNLIADESFVAAERLLGLIRAVPDEDESGIWTRLQIEFEFLNALPSRGASQEARRVVVATELVDRFSDHEVDEVRAEVVLIAATLEVRHPASAAAWLRSTRARPDFQELMKFDRVREAVVILERWAGEDAVERQPGPVNEDNQEILDLLRWWSEPGAPIPLHAQGITLPPPGGVDLTIIDQTGAKDAMILATALASIGRYGDARACVRAVADYSEVNGFDLTHALAKVIEGELLVFADRVSEASDCLWFSAFELRRLGRLDTALQAFLELARLGSTHPELDDTLADRVNPDEDGPPGSRIVAVANVARALATETGDELGRWTADLVVAQTLFTLGRVDEARRALDRLPPPPDGSAVNAARAQLLLARIRIQLACEGSAAARLEMEAAEYIPAARRPWFAWQLHALRAEIEIAAGQLAEAWSASQQALTGLRSLRVIVGDERDRASWSASRSNAWLTALRIAAWRERPDHALAVIEDAKSTHLAHLVLAQAASGPDAQTTALLRNALSRLSANAEAGSGLDRDAADRAHRDSREVLREVRIRDAYLATALDPPAMDSQALNRLRATMGEFVLLDYLDAGGDAIWRVSATAAGALEVRELELLESHRETLASLDTAADPDQVNQWMSWAGDLTALKDLGRLLFAGLHPEVDWPAQLVISPSGRLANIPWATLSFDGQPLIDRFAITLVPSLVLGLALPNTHDASLPAIMFCCDPDEDLSGVAAQRDALRTVLPDLQVVEGPTAALSKLVETSYDGDLVDARALIWAGHGFVHPEEPLASGLLLGDGSVVTAGALGALRLPANVELWTCSSSAERRLHFDEQLGLVAGCVRAGASTVVATLWPIADGAVAAISATYCERRQAGATPAQALRLAQLAHRDHLPEAAWAAATVWGTVGEPPRQSATALPLP